MLWYITNKNDLLVIVLVNRYRNNDHTLENQCNQYSSFDRNTMLTLVQFPSLQFKKGKALLKVSAH